MAIPNNCWLPWCEDCYRYVGHVLNGEYAHWCMEWDGLPVDETMHEFVHCLCWEDDETPTEEREKLRLLKECLRAERAEQERLWLATRALERRRARFGWLLRLLRLV